MEAFDNAMLQSISAREGENKPAQKEEGATSQENH